jgi:xanthine dehydrogenase iron-sulfur cluster and FAD-binding subunit A
MSWEIYFTPRNLDEALSLLAEAPAQTRLVAGATDLMLELERGLRQGVSRLIDITRIPGLDQIRLDEAGWIRLGPLVTHNQVAASKLIRERAFALARACWEVGAPQIRNRATVAGNLITASPANDSISPLMALDARLRLLSLEGERTVDLRSFYIGVRKTVMRPDEILVEIAFPAPPAGARSAFLKLGLRRAQSISVVNVAAVVELAGSAVRRAAIALGAVTPVIARAQAAESWLVGKPLSDVAIAEAARLALQSATPIDDLRGSAAYRRQMVEVCVRRCLQAIASGDMARGYPDEPVMLSSASGSPQAPLGALLRHQAGDEIRTTINGKAYRFTTGHDKSLLRLLREEAGLIGTKEGCAEGECGACSVFVDGVAVMACMVPAPRAHGAVIETIEGLANEGELHPLQRAFIEEGAVQCGYCTPGFLMAGAKLLEERPHPSRFEIQQAFAGNLCRCTGYYSIISAVERAAALMAGSK